MPRRRERTHDHFARICGELRKWTDEEGFDLKAQHTALLAGLDARGGESKKLRGVRVRDHDWFRDAVIESAVRYLYFRRKRRPTIDKPVSGFHKKIREGLEDWVLMEFGIDRSSVGTPEADDIGKYPQVTGDDQVDQKIALSAMSLADEYDQHLIDDKKQETRKRQHDRLSGLMVEKPDTFANESDRSTRDKNLKMLRQLRNVEDIRVKQYGPPLVGLRDPRRISLTDRMKMNDVLARMPTLGGWSGQRSPLRAAAAARSIYHGERGGFSFSVNLSLEVRWAAKEAQKPFHSHIQDRVRRALKSGFGELVDFYFIIENGLGERPHIHGAVDLERTSQNRHALRAALHRVSGGWVARNKSGYRVHTLELYAPVKWVHYTFKRDASARRSLSIYDPLCMTQGLSQKAKVQWELMREEQREARRAEHS